MNSFDDSSLSFIFFLDMGYFSFLSFFFVIMLSLSMSFISFFIAHTLMVTLEREKLRYHLEFYFVVDGWMYLLSFNVEV